MTIQTAMLHVAHTSVGTSGHNTGVSLAGT